MADAGDTSILGAAIPLDFPLEVKTLPQFERPLEPGIREARLLSPPWVRTLGKLTMEVSTEGWRFPAPLEPPAPVADAPGSRGLRLYDPEKRGARSSALALPHSRTRLRPPADAVVFKERLLYLLQPPLEDSLFGKQMTLPFPPYPSSWKELLF